MRCKLFILRLLGLTGIVSTILVWYITFILASLTPFKGVCLAFNGYGEWIYEFVFFGIIMPIVWIWWVVEEYKSKNI